MSEIIVRLAARGDGVTMSGRYVAGAVPGDSVDGDVVSPGPHRVLPPCVHFGRCGGCQLQHVDESVLADFVTGRALGALAGVGITPKRTHPAHLSPPRTRRRASLRAIRRKQELIVGFNVERGHEVIDLEECHVLTDRLWSAVRGLRVTLARVLRPGAQANLTLTEAANGLDLVIGGADFGAAEVTSLAELAESLGIARITGDEGILIQRADPVVVVDGINVALPPGGFLQATADAEAALQRAVIEAVGGATSVADLFCGIGTFALPIARKASVLAADAAGPAVAALSTAARTAGLTVKTEHRDLFRQPYDAKDLNTFGGVVLDPPRAGASAQVNELAKSRVGQVVYVSCNPNTFARDAKTLVDAGFTLEELWPVGQFRWSLHVELVASFSRS